MPGLDLSCPGAQITPCRYIYIYIYSRFYVCASQGHAALAASGAKSGSLDCVRERGREEEVLVLIGGSLIR